MSKKLKAGMKAVLVNTDKELMVFTLLKAEKAKSRNKFLIETIEFKGMHFNRTLTMGRDRYKESISLSRTKNPDVDWKNNDVELLKVKNAILEIQNTTKKIKGPIVDYITTDLIMVDQIG